MRSDVAYDPVTAIDESAAAGDTALAFAEIRRTIDIPLVTSIWRRLAGMDDSLRPAWEAAKPIYQSGEPERALSRSIAAVNLPSPEPLAPTALTCIGMTEGDVWTVRTVVAAYNRSNGLNLLALAALIAPTATGSGTVTAFGASGIDAGIAKLWRHLAHWPGLLALIHGAFAPLQSRGLIDEANARLVALSETEGARMARLRPTLLTLSLKALAIIAGYVRIPTQVARMVAIGHTLAAWLGR